MTKIIISVIATTGPSGPLYQLVDNLNNQNSEVSIGRSEDSLDVIIDDSSASSEQKLVIDEANILAILAENGEIEDYVFGIRAPLSSANTIVPVGIPIRTNISGVPRDFQDWFVPQSAEVWKNTVLGEFIYHNNPNPSGLPYLLASEADIIRQLDPDTFSFMTLAELETEVALPNWTKL